jgi:hypothetical protein
MRAKQSWKAFFVAPQARLMTEETKQTVRFANFSKWAGAYPQRLSILIVSGYQPVLRKQMLESGTGTRSVK